MKKILLVEDERRLLEITTDYLESAGYYVLQADNGQKALDLFEENNVDLVVLDVMLPEVDGWTVCRRIRKNSGVPIIMLTARGEEDDKLMGFELGADEYVTKPFSPKVLVARVTTLIKRINVNITSADQEVIFGNININEKSHIVKFSEKPVELTPKEYDLLLYLIKNKGIVLSREVILDKVWGYDFFGELRVVDSHIKKLRKKLGQNANYIKTIVKVGYRIEVNDGEK